MSNPLKFSRSIRNEIEKICTRLSTEQLNQIPLGANNNIAWQLGHIVVSTEILCYLKTEVDPLRIIPFIEDYKNGTRPKSYISESEIKQLMEYAQTSLNQIEADLHQGRFKQTTSYKTNTIPVEVDDIESVLLLCSHHDSWHYGQIRLLKKMLLLK